MLNRLLSFIEKHNILNNSQHGFRTKYHTVTANIDVINYITQAINNKLYTVGLFLDVSKTFGIVNHDILLTKLDHYGFRGFVNSWLSSYAVYDNQCSFLRIVTAVVPQDTIIIMFYTLMKL